MAWAAVGGAAVSAVGGYLSSQGSATSAPKFRPYDVTTGMGTADWDRKGKQINAALSPEQQAFANQYNTMAQQYLSGGGATNPFQQFAMGGVQGAIPGLFGGALNASQGDQASLDAYLGNMSGLAGSTGGMYNTLNSAGMNILGGGGPMGQANQMFGLGQQLMGNNYNDVFNNRLGLLREQAAPFESRAADSFLNRQYAMGRMGSTGGGRDVEAFARGLGQADTTRQLDAMNLSENLYGRDQSMGAGLMGTGLQGVLGSLGAGQSLFGLGANLGSSLGNMYGAGFQASQGYNDMTNARAQQRMTNAMSLFGFGNTLGQQDISTGTSLQGIPMNMYQQMMEQAKIGGSAGGAAMTPGSTNPGMVAGGQFLGGIGNAMAMNPGLFARQQPSLDPGLAGGAYNNINAQFGGNYLSGMI